MATIGQSLPSPESSWKRYDDNIPCIVRSSGWIYYSGANYYGGGAWYTTSANQTLKFDFIGTKIRLIYPTATNRSTNIKISIDGVEETFSGYSTGATYYALVYEKTGLQNTRHRVVITTTEDSKEVGIDAIDIDDTGRLLHPDEVTNLEDLAIGKRIRANYKASSGTLGIFGGLGKETKDFIPSTSSATPDGDFYFICVDKDHLGRWKLIADRNIQHSISWDVLNSVGVASGSGIPYYFYFTNDLLDPSVIIQANSSYTGLSPNLLIDDDEVTTWATNTGSTGWISCEFATEKIIKMYTIKALKHNASLLNRTPKSWKLEGWNGTVWETVHEVTGQTGWALGEKRAFICNNNKGYKKYRLNVTENNGGDLLQFAEIEMMEVANDDYDFTIRLLTGGVTVADTDNEWDKYIVGGTLNGTITAGDNGVWNWNGVYSWTNTTPQSLPSSRTTRGNTSANNVGNSSTANANNTLGFRPVLLIESTQIVSPPTTNSSLYKIESGLLFIDDFNSINSKWTVSPLNAYSITERPGFLRMKHDVGYDTLVLTDIPSDEEVAIEVFADYSPTEPGDEGGIIVWKNASEKIEFLEKFDSGSSIDYTSWLAVKNGTDWRFFSDYGNGYVFIDSDVIDANKFGMVLKRGNNGNFVNLDVDKVIVTKGNKVTIMNVQLGCKVALLDNNGVEISSDYATLYPAVQLTLPTLEFNGTIVVYDETNTELCRIDATFHGGDVYSIGSNLEVRFNGTELSKNSQTDIGTLISGLLEVQMEIHNPSPTAVYNVQISISQYLDKFGWTWVDIALDNGGSPGVYGDSISISQINAGETIPFWVKVVKGTDYVGFEPLQFNINVTHD
jgi:hypothetical protein